MVSRPSLIGSKGLISVDLLAFFLSIELANSFALSFDSNCWVGTSKYSGSPTKWDLLLCPLLIASDKRW